MIRDLLVIDRFEGWWWQSEIKHIWHNKNVEFVRVCWAVILNSKGKGTLFSVQWWFCFSISIIKYAFLTRTSALIHPIITISKEMVLHFVFKIQFQSGELCSLPLPFQYLHTDISHAMEMHFPHCCTYGLWLLFCSLHGDHIFLALLS